MITTLTSAYSVLSRHEFADVMQNQLTGEKSLHATRFFDSGELISPFGAGMILDHPNYLTVQTGIEKHITLAPEFLQYINHSCAPNCFFDTEKMELVALRPIQPGDEFSFFYPSTEWDMAQPFQCFCGTSACLKNIRGARWLTKKDVRSYQFTAFIREQLRNRKQP
jgi:hypothetical protein